MQVFTIGYEGRSLAVITTHDGAAGAGQIPARCATKSAVAPVAAASEGRCPPLGSKGMAPPMSALASRCYDAQFGTASAK